MPKKQTGMLFNEEMVLAILAGLKTQTRRPIKSQPHKKAKAAEKLFGEWWFYNRPNRKGKHNPGMPLGAPVKSPYGGVGDLIWVRETWNKEGGLVTYRSDGDWIADFNRDFPNRVQRKWNPSTHMPKWACRLWLEITNVRVERVNAITEEDAIAEGFTGVAAFREYWVSSYGRGSWDKGWCWVYDFKRVERP